MENKDNEYLREKLLMMGENTTLREIQEYIDEMVNIRGWQNETPQDTMLLLTEEIGELAKEVRKSCTHIQNDVNKNRATTATAYRILNLLKAKSNTDN